MAYRPQVATIAQGGSNAITFTQSNGIVTYNGTSLVNYAGPQIDSSGRQTNTTQPAFLVYVNTDITNVTGDTTSYTIIYDTEVFDQGSNFNLGTGIFTAPVSGKYFLSASTVIVNGTNISAGFMTISTSNRSYLFAYYPSQGSTTFVGMTGSVLADMDSADIVLVNVLTTDSGGKIDDVAGLGGGNIRTLFSGNLVC